MTYDTLHQTVGDGQPLVNTANPTLSQSADRLLIIIDECLEQVCRLERPAPSDAPLEPPMAAPAGIGKKMQYACLALEALRHRLEQLAGLAGEAL